MCARRKDMFGVNGPVHTTVILITRAWVRVDHLCQSDARDANKTAPDSRATDTRVRQRKVRITRRRPCRKWRTNIQPSWHYGAVPSRKVDVIARRRQQRMNSRSRSRGREDLRGEAVG